MFFFFQAEDGIRDLIVTGVQTCALPISMETRVAAMETRVAAMETRAAALESRDARLNRNPDSIPKGCTDTFPRIGQSTTDGNSVNVSSNFESFAATVQAISAELDSVSRIRQI